MARDPAACQGYDTRSIFCLNKQGLKTTIQVSEPLQQVVVKEDPGEEEEGDED